MYIHVQLLVYDNARECPNFSCCTCRSCLYKDANGRLAHTNSILNPFLVYRHNTVLSCFVGIQFYTYTLHSVSPYCILFELDKVGIVILVYYIIELMVATPAMHTD